MSEAGDIIGVVPRLTAERERELALLRPALGPEAWRASEARRTLILANVPWTLTLANEHGDDRLGDDRFGVALYWLCRSVDQYDPARGRMTNYLKRVIPLYLRRAAQEQVPLIHVPTDVQDHIWATDLKPGVPRHRPQRAEMVGPGRAALAPMVGGLGWGGWIEPADGRRSPDEEREAEVAARVDRVRLALVRLPDHLADAVRQRHFPEEPHVAVSRGALEYRLKHAYARLREMLSESGKMTA